MTTHKKKESFPLIFKILLILLVLFVGIQILGVVLLGGGMFYQTWQNENQGSQKLAGYTYLGGLEAVGGRKFEGYWKKDNSIYYVTSDAYSNIHSIELLQPQPAIENFRVYTDEDKNGNILNVSKFSDDKKNIYYQGKAILPYVSDSFVYLKKETEQDNKTDIYFMYENTKYKISTICEECSVVKVE